MDDDFKTYGVEYNADGKMWVMHVMARSEQDARARLYRAAHSGKVIGELKASITVPGGGLIARLRSYFQRGGDKSL